MTPLCGVAPMRETTDDACHRCGYNLTGIANQQPCPECGLLAERSRRVTDELHQSRPGWLRRMSWGIWLILLAVVSPILLANMTQQVEEWMYRWRWGYWFGPYNLPLLLIEVPAVFLTMGVFLVASRDRHGPCDKSDRRLCRSLRLAMLVPWAAFALMHFSFFVYHQRGWTERYRWSEFAALALCTLGSTPIPILLALRLRALAVRERSAHLAEHCLIVGIGTALTLAYTFAMLVITDYSQEWGWQTHWLTRGRAGVMIAAGMGTLCVLFFLWEVYLLIRFAITFGGAARFLRRQWRRDDRSQINPADSPRA